jgi:hypothetical protein
LFAINNFFHVLINAFSFFFSEIKLLKLVQLFSYDKFFLMRNWYGIIFD